MPRLPPGFAYVPVLPNGLFGTNGAHDIAAYEPPRKQQRVGHGGHRVAGGGAGDAQAAPRGARQAAHHHHPGATWDRQQQQAAAQQRHGPVAPPGAGAPPLSAAQAKALHRERCLTVKKRVAELSALVDALATSVTAAAAERAAAAAAAAAAPPVSAAPLPPPGPPPPVAVLDPATVAKLEASRVKRVADVVSRQCLGAVKHLMAHKWAWPFNEPVDATKMGLADYHSVVQTPMDLGTIKQGLEAGGVYAHPDQVAAHIRLVFANARRYNPPGSDVHIMAGTLAEAFEGRWAATVTPKLADTLAASQAELDKATARVTAAATARLQSESERTAMDLERRVAAAEAALHEARTALGTLCQPLTPEERRALANGLRDMDPHSLTGAVAVVAAAAGVDPADAPDVVDIDLELGDPLMLRRLMAYITTAPKKPSAAAAEARKAAALAAAEEQRAARAANAAASRQRRAAGARTTRRAGDRTRRRSKTAAGRARQRSKLREGAAAVAGEGGAPAGGDADDGDGDGDDADDGAAEEEEEGEPDGGGDGGAGDGDVDMDAAAGGEQDTPLEDAAAPDGDAADAMEDDA